MNKKIKIIIAVSVVVVAAVLIGVLSWGLQPVIKDEVSLEKLNKKLDGIYSVPSRMPFDGDVECCVYYNEPAFGVVLLRFEATTKKITGYTIELQDEELKREICIDNRVSSALALPNEDEPLIANYKNTQIHYFYVLANEEGKKNLWLFQFSINDKSYTITAIYDKNIDANTLKSDVGFLLDQMI